MESTTKARLSNETIHFLTKQAFINADHLHIEELVDGMCNRVYFITGHGIPKEKVVLKVGPEECADILTYERNTIYTEVNVYHLLEELPIPTPRLYHCDLTHKHIPCDYFFMEYVEGVTWLKGRKNITQQNHPQLLYEIGKYNAVIHSITGPYFGYMMGESEVHFSSWSKAFTSMVDHILSDGKKHQCDLPYEKIKLTLKRNQELLDCIKEPRLVDFDLWAGNVFLEKDKFSHILSIFDFGPAFYGDPYADFISAYGVFDDVEKEIDFCRGYSEITGRPLRITNDDRKRMNLYRLYMQIILYVEAYRYEQDMCRGRRKHAQRAIHMLLEELE